MLPGYSPRWPCAQLFLWQPWSKCNDDKILRVLFFLHAISSLQWQSHLFPPQAESWWMSRTTVHRHSHHMWNMKCMNVKVLGTWISSACCQRHSVMQSVMVGLCPEKRTSRTAPRWQLMSQCFVSSAFSLMHAKLHSHAVPAIFYLFNTIPPLPCTAMQLVSWRFWKVWSLYGTHIPAFHLVVCSFFFCKWNMILLTPAHTA